MSHHPIVTIQGSGIVGMSLALHLARLPLRVHWVTPTPTPQAAAAKRDVRVYAINHAGKAVLQAIDCWPDDGVSVTAVPQMQIYGDTFGHLTFGQAQAEPITWIVDVPALEDQLRQAVRAESRIHHTHHAPDHSDLTVICEGRMAASREAAGLHMTQRWYAHHAIATRLHAELAHQGTAYQWFDGEHILGVLPIGGANSHEVGVVWSVPPTTAREWMALPEEERATRLGEQLTQTSQHKLGTLTVNAPISSWPLMLGQTEQWVAPGIALAGDAAHAVHPLAGHGLNLGLEDVACLSKLLAERKPTQSPGDWKLLRRYQRHRTWDTASMQGVTDALFYLFNSSTAKVPGLAWLRNAGMSALQRMPQLKNKLVAQAMSGS
jgi:ubiquinone biosynthesis UbiH/UbiF/VisC/COQ6 family hydroxylase